MKLPLIILPVILSQPQSRIKRYKAHMTRMSRISNLSSLAMRVALDVRDN